MGRSTVLISIGLLLALAAPAGAAPGWSTPRSVPTAESTAADPTVAVDAAGRAVVAWKRHSSSFEGIRAAIESAPGQFGETRTLTAGNESDPRLGGVVSADNGEALVAWCSRIDGVLAVRVAQRAAGGEFGPAQTLASGQPPRGCPRVAMNARGDAVIAWSAYGQPQIVFKPAGAGLGGTETVPGPGSDYPTSVAIDADGNARLLWAVRAGGDAAIRLAAGRRSVAAVITPGDYVSPVYDQAASGQFDYDIAADGSVSAIWSLYTSETPAPVYSAVSGAADTGLGAASVLNAFSTAGTDQRPSALATRAGSSALFVRSGSSEENGCRRLVIGLNSATGSNAGASLSLPDQAAGWTGDRPIGGRPASSAFVAWRRSTTAEPVGDASCGKLVSAEATAATFSPSAGLGEPVAISDPRYPVTIPRAGQGDRLAAAWRCFDGRKHRVQVASYADNAGNPLGCGPEDLGPPKVSLRTSRYPMRWRSTSRPAPRARCHEQCSVTVGLLLFSRGKRAIKLGVSEQVLKAGRTKRLQFPELSRGARRLVGRTVRLRSNVRLIFRLRFDDLALNSKLRTARVRLY